LTDLAVLPGTAVAGRLGLHKLTVTYTSGHPDTGTIDTFEKLTRAIDTALAAPGFTRYVSAPGGER
jgi:hypothetical protein